MSEARECSNKPRVETRRMQRRPERMRAEWIISFRAERITRAPLSLSTQSLANIIKLIEDAAPVKKCAHVKRIYFPDTRKLLQQPGDETDLIIIFSLMENTGSEQSQFFNYGQRDADSIHCHVEKPIRLHVRCTTLGALEYATTFSSASPSSPPINQNCAANAHETPNFSDSECDATYSNRMKGVIGANKMK